MRSSLPKSRKLSPLRQKTKSRTSVRVGLPAAKSTYPRKSDYMAYHHPGEVCRRRAWKDKMFAARQNLPSSRQVVMGVPKKTWMREDSAVEPYSIFACVPSASGPPREMNFDLQRQTFGAVSSVASISEKFSLLSGTRTRDSSRLLEKRRCFSIHLTPHERSRQTIARGLMARNERNRHMSLQSSIEEGSSVSTTVPSLPRPALVPRPQWIRDSQSDLSDDEADAIWEAGSERLFGEARHLSSTPDVSLFTGGNTIKLTVEIHHSAKGGPVKAKVALDTQSDVTTCLRQYLMDVHQIQPDEVSGVEGSASFTEEGTLYIFSEPKGQRVAIPALVAPPHQLPAECVALLGVPALLQLEVALDQHLRLPRFFPLICHLGEKKLREWLVHHPDSSIDTAPFDLKAIQINPELVARMVGTPSRFQHRHGPF
jgi:hypothetical protein